MWREMQVSSSGTYLGFAVGPGKMDKSWTRAAEKYRERVAIWENQPLGLQCNALVYNTFAMSVLGYLAQLESPPRWLLEMESEMHVKQIHVRIKEVTQMEMEYVITKTTVMIQLIQTKWIVMATE
jgi:hypothetical protein